MEIKQLFLVVGLAWLASTLPRLALACNFDAASLAFRGTPVEQAKCLLRTVQYGGIVDSRPAELPKVLVELVGKNVTIEKAQFRALLRKEHIIENDVGGALDEPLSHAKAGEASAPTARYFVIHDTAYNLCDRQAFPPNQDHPDASWNTVRRWNNNSQAHLYITRDGKFIRPQGRSFGTPWRATKFEKLIGEDSQGLFLHIENVQLRRAELSLGQPAKLSDGTCVNARIASVPGLSATQLDRLALAYIAASIRATRWLVPAFHAVLDEGIPHAHDDPQNFDLTGWGKSLYKYMQEFPSYTNPEKPSINAGS